MYQCVTEIYMNSAKTVRNICGTYEKKHRPLT